MVHHYLYGLQISIPYVDGGDFSGCQVTADKPIYVQSGALQGTVGSTLKSGDHLADTLPDVSTLGTRYYIVSFARRTSGDVLKIIGRHVKGNRARD